ncbi:MAG: hypothetical protein HY537_07470, partial [Deltaproteobacteria bacterium]|nr:hypothetical protein [Deltaproteobacteria bacterium]
MIRFGLWCLIFSLSPGVYAHVSDIRSELDKLDSQAIRLQPLSRVRSKRDADFDLRLNEAFAKIESVSVSIQKEIAQLLSQIKKGATRDPRVALKDTDPVAKLKHEIWGGMQWAFGEVIPTTDPNHPLFKLEINRDTVAAIEAHILQGGVNLEPVIELLELSLSDIELVGFALNFEIIKANPKTLPLIEFLGIQAAMELALMRAQALFPGLPEIVVGDAWEDVAAGIVKKEQFDKVVSAHLSAFVSSFGNAHERYQKRIRDVFILIARTMGEIRRYHLLQYPQDARDARMLRLEEALHSIPSNRECFHYALGVGSADDFQFVSHFENPPCNPQFFKQNLERLISYYKRHVDPGFQRRVRNTIFRFIENSEENQRTAQQLQPAWEKTLKALDENVANSQYPARLVEKWPSIRSAISNIEKLMVQCKDPVALDTYLKQVFAQNQLVPAAGFGMDFSANVGFAEKLLEAFSNPKSHLSSVPDKLERIDTATSCELFKQKDFGHSPWVMNTTGFVNTEGEIRPSSRGEQRLIWYRTAKIGNAVAIQSPHNPNVLAGLSVRTAATLIIPN